VVLRALEVKPELRYPTAAEFRTQVESVTKLAVHEPVQRAARRSDKWIVPSFSVLFFFAGLVVGILVINALPLQRDSGHVALVAVMFCLTPRAGVLAGGLVSLMGAVFSGAPLRVWLKGLGSLAMALALVAIGFGLFFLQAILGERGAWNPALPEALLVPLTGWVPCPAVGRLDVVAFGGHDTRQLPR
jgi:hypothetical protein